MSVKWTLGNSSWRTTLPADSERQVPIATVAGEAQLVRNRSLSNPTPREARHNRGHSIRSCAGLLAAGSLRPLLPRPAKGSAQVPSVCCPGPQDDEANESRSIEHSDRLPGRGALPWPSPHLRRSHRDGAGGAEPYEWPQGQTPRPLWSHTVPTRTTSPVPRRSHGGAPAAIQTQGEDHPRSREPFVRSQESVRGASPGIPQRHHRVNLLGQNQGIKRWRRGWNRRIRISIPPGRGRARCRLVPARSVLRRSHCRYRALACML